MKSMYIPDDMASTVTRISGGGGHATKAFTESDQPWLPFVNDEAFRVAMECAMWRKHVCTWNDVETIERETGEAYSPNLAESHVFNWLKAVEDLFRVIRSVCSQFDATVFINWGYVAHNVNMSGDETQPYVSGDEAVYNKELVVLVKEPGEELTMQLFCSRMKLVEPWLRELHKHHVERRIFFFEGLTTAAGLCVTERTAHQVALSVDVADAKDRELCMAASARKHDQAFPQRGEWAEYSSREYLRRVLEPLDTPLCTVIHASWDTFVG